MIPRLDHIFEFSYFCSQFSHTFSLHMPSSALMTLRNQQEGCFWLAHFLK